MENQKTNDRHTVTIAVGKTSKLGRIENRSLSWGDLKKQLGKPHVDEEITIAEYALLSKKEQSRRKGLPGFWNSSTYVGHRRRKTDVVERGALILDLDCASPLLLELLNLGLLKISDLEFFAHTTRGDTARIRKLRIVIPLSRPVGVEEAAVLTRRVAEMIGSEEELRNGLIDKASFDPNQVMFFASVSKDQEFKCIENMGRILDVDAELSLVAVEEEAMAPCALSAKKLEDPRTKPGIIGAFCRAYSVHDVIEKYLPEVYLPSASGNGDRFSFAPGSSEDGVVAYEDGRFLYSHHDTDPVDGCVNAFDLLRIHKFGYLDEDVPDDTKPSDLPSFQALKAFVENDERVSMELSTHLHELLDEIVGAESNAEDWANDLRAYKNGAIQPVLANAILICRNDPRIAACIGFNEFTMDPVCLRRVQSRDIETPSRAVDHDREPGGRRWEESDDVSIRAITSATRARGGYETDFSQQIIQDAVLVVARQNPIHPIKDFIRSCHTEYLKRGAPTGLISKLSSKYLGTPDTRFHRESSRMLLIAAVARIFEPGCKFDNMVVIEGPTGSRKSTFVSVLFGGFASELKCDLDRTDRVIENLRGNWAVEIAEMAAAKRADSNTLKTQLSSQSDSHRMAYARREQTFPRQSLFIGTTNENDYLSDPTSNRRFWVWRTPKTQFDPIDINDLKANLWAIWGEAYKCYLEMRSSRPGGDLWLDLESKDAIQEARTIAEGSRKPTAVETMSEEIAAWLETPQRAGDLILRDDGPEEHFEDDTLVVRNMVTAAEVYRALHKEPTMAAFRNADVRTYGRALKLVSGWRELGRVRRFGASQSNWFCRGIDGQRWAACNEQA